MQDPQTLDEYVRLFNQQAIPPTAGVQQRQSMNEAFIAGFLSCFELMCRYADLPDGADEAAMLELHDQMTKHQERILARTVELWNAKP